MGFSFFILIKNHLAQFQIVYFCLPFLSHRWAVASRFCMTKTYLALPLFPLWGGGRGSSVDGHEQGSRFIGTLAPLEWETEGSLDFTFYHKNKHPKSKIQCACSERLACGGERWTWGYLHIMRITGRLGIPSGGFVGQYRNAALC